MSNPGSHPLPERVTTATPPSWCREIPPGEALHFHFQLRGLGEHEATAGRLQGELILVGNELSGLDVVIDGLPAPMVEAVAQFEGRELGPLPVSPPNGSVSVELSGRPGQRPACPQAPEVSGKTAYPDAVYLLFHNDTTRLLYHTRGERKEIR